MRIEPDNHTELVNRLSQKPELIERIEQRLVRDDKIGINIGSQEGLLLKSLCAQVSVEKVVEIGTQYGCSASWMAMGLGRSGKIWTFEKDEQAISEAKKTFSDSDFLALGCEVELFEGAAIERLREIESQGPFDLIFIDANKSGYFDYWNWAKRNVAVGGLIVADNVYLFGSIFETTCPEKTPVKMWKVMNQMLEDAFSDSGFSSSIVPTLEGLLISTKLPD